MQRLIAITRELWDDESGQDMVEYVMIIVFLALAVTVALLAMQGSMSDVFTNTSETVQSETPF